MVQFGSNEATPSPDSAPQSTDSSEFSNNPMPSQYQLFPPHSSPNDFLLDMNLTTDQEAPCSLFHWDTEVHTSQGTAQLPPPALSEKMTTQAPTPNLSAFTTSVGQPDLTSDAIFNGQTGLIDNPPSTTSWNLENSFLEVDNKPCQLDNIVFPSQTMQEQTSEATSIPQERRNSTDSSGAESSSSGDTFSTSYTDTITSAHSTDLLLKPSDDTDEESGELQHQTEPVNEVYFNTGYTSYSSSETLDSEVSEKEQTEGEALLVNLNEDVSITMEPPKEPVEDEINDQSAEILQDFVHHHLIPISEHEVVSFTAEEVEPSTYVKITNNITVADESFLFMSQTSLADHDGKSDKRATTMNNLHERSSFLDLTDINKVGRACQKALLYLKDDITFGSMASLNKMTNKGFEKETAQSISLIEGSKALDIVPSTRHTRNLVYLSLCITLLFIAIGSVRNLQSSINHEGGVGVISMAVGYIGYMGGSIFSVSIVQNFQPRMCIILNLIPNLLYVAANIYPAMWLMVPISFVQGISMAILWNAMSTYITFLARGRAEKKNERLDLVSGRFFGLFCLLYQSYLIIGNLIASLVLMLGNSGAPTALVANSSFINGSSQPVLAQDTMFQPEMEMPLPVELDPFLSEAPSSNQTLNDVEHLHLCGAAFCNHFELGGGGFAVSDQTKYTLFGIYFGCIVLAMLIAIFLLEPLNIRLFSTSASRVQRLKSQLLSMCKFTTNRNFLLLLPLLMYSVMQFGFITAEVTMAFVTCPLGIHMVGYTMICFGVCGSISSYLSGLLNKFTGRVPPILFAAGLNLGALIAMSMWKPNLDSLVPYFVIMGIWGVGDGIWISQISSLMGNVFPEKYEEAYAGLRVAQGLGVAITFGYSNSLCMASKIYIMAAICVVAVVGYLTMEVLLKKESKAKIVVLKQTSV